MGQGSPQSSLNPFKESPMSTTNLVAAAKRGEREAFEELCRSCSERIFRTLLRITKNREDAEDALQESLLSAFVHLKEFDERASFSTWLTRIAINSALMILRKKRQSRELSMDGSVDGGVKPPQWEIADVAPNPEKVYVQGERAVILQRAISELRPSIRAVIEIHQLQEHSMKETAGRIGISVGATKARLFQAKMALRKKYRMKEVRSPRASWAA
jgi:RNA polymerase sigma factor (sigma-70 family)